MLKMGISASSAAKIFQLFSVLTGLFRWIGLACAFLKSRTARVVFVCLLVAQLLPWGVYSTAAFSWSATALLSCIMLNLRGEQEESGWQNVWLASALVAILIIFRYQNVTLLATGACWLFLTQIRKWRTGLVQALTYSIVPALTFLGIILSNRYFAGNNSFLSRRTMNTSWDWEWIPQILNAFFLGGTFRLDDALRNFAQAHGASAWGDWIGEGLGVISLGISIGFTTPLAKCDLKFRRLLNWFLLCFAPLLAMFLILAISSNYLSFLVGRYYHFLTPLFLILIVWAVSDRLRVKLSNKGKTIFLSAVISITAFAIIGYSKYRFDLSRNSFEKSSWVSRQIREIQAQDPSASAFIVADFMFPGLVLEGFQNIYNNTDVFLSEKTRFSKPTWVFVVPDVSPAKPMYVPLENVPSITQKFHFEKRESHGVQVYWKKFNPGTLRAQMGPGA
jgi:hypothetical protein